MAAGRSWVRVVHCITRDPAERRAAYHRRIDGDVLREVLDGAVSALSCLCGPPAMVDAVSAALHGLGWTPGPCSARSTTDVSLTVPLAWHSVTIDAAAGRTRTRTSGNVEVPATLAEPAPQLLGLVDQLGLWGNLGVSLLGFAGAMFVLQPGGGGTPRLSMAAGLTSMVVGPDLLRPGDGRRAERGRLAGQARASPGPPGPGAGAGWRLPGSPTTGTCSATSAGSPA